VGPQTVGNAWNGLAARMEQAERLLHWLEQSQRIQVFRQTTVFLQKVPQSQKLTCAANTSHSNKVADFYPKPGDNLLIFLRTSKIRADHHAS